MIVTETVFDHIKTYIEIWTKSLVDHKTEINWNPMQFN
jgi:hypothetical protein